MYVFDPQQGRRRRARLRDKLIHYNRKTRAGIDATARDIRNRTAGVAFAARKVFSGKDVNGTPDAAGAHNRARPREPSERDHG